MNKLLKGVPEITLFFWVIKIMATTVGETAADFLSFTMKLGLVNTSTVMSGLLLVALLIDCMPHYSTKEASTGLLSDKK